MQYLFIAITASVIVSVLLKLFPRWGVDVRVAVGANYAMCLGLTWWLLRPASLSSVFQNVTSSVVALVLGVLLPSVFVVMYRGVQSVGVVRADVAQRLSLFLSLAAAFFLFDSQLNHAKIIGLVLALVALFLLMVRTGEGQGSAERALSATRKSGQSAFWLLGIWLGYGVIDIFFKTMSKQAIGFTSTLFVTFSLALIFMWVYIGLQRVPVTLKSLGGGLLLGVFNFFNIWAYVMAHMVFKGNAALVFATMNIGVMSLALVVGSVALKERMNPWNIVGVACAIVSILVMWLMGGF